MSVPATTGDWREFDADSASDNPNPRFRPRNHREPTRTRKTGAILWPMPRPFPLVLLASCTIALAGLSACDSKTGGFAPSPAPVEPPAEIAIDDFKKVALRVGRVVSAEKHPSADKLLVLQDLKCGAH